MNRSTTGKGLSIQAGAIAPKIKEIDDLLLPAQQSWVFEVHPEDSSGCGRMAAGIVQANDEDRICHVQRRRTTTRETRAVNIG